MGKTKVKNINDSISNFVNTFLVDNKISEEVVQSWTSDENQKALDKLIKISKKKEEKKEEKKINKHKDEPKRSSSSYICFCKAKRKEVKDKFKDLNNQEIMVKLGELWKSLLENEKEKWDKEAEKDKERYKKDLEKFYKEHPDQVKKPTIKRPLSAYVIYCNNKRNEIKDKNPSLVPTEIMSLLGKMWKDLSDKEKDQWKLLADKDKERYNKEISEEEKDLEIVIQEETEVKVEISKKPSTKGKKDKKKNEEVIVEEEVVETKVEEKPAKKTNSKKGKK